VTRAVLAWDPSSTGTGWALLPLSGELAPLASGLICRPETWPVHLRLRCLAGEIARVYAALEGRVHRVVVEIPGTAQAGRARRKFSTSGAYAAAVGIVLAESWRLAPPGCEVVAVASDHWTRLGGHHGVPKARRLASLARVGAYDGKDDAGGDRGDAIHLAAWYAWHHGREDDSGCALYLPAAKAGRLTPAGLEADGDGGLRPLGARWKPSPSVG